MMVMSRTSPYATVMAAISTQRALTKRQFRLADLADREENTTLAQEIRARANTHANVNGTRIVELPPVGTLGDLWKKLGFKFDVYQDVEQFEVVGIHRRLAAALRSIRTRGFDAGDFTFGEEVEVGSREFLWESTRGAWGDRHWRVTGTISLSQSEIQVTDTIVSVKSTRGGDAGVDVWTAFVGGPLNAVVSARLKWVVAVIGGRLIHEGHVAVDSFGLVSDKLTEQEVNEYHDLHPSPTTAFKDSAGNRVVLVDDGYGSGALHGTAGWPNEAETKLVTTLAQIAWGYFTPCEEAFGSIPRSEREDF